MTVGDGRFPRDCPVELKDVETNLRGVIAQLDEAGQMLAAAYAELALGALRALPARQSPQTDDPVNDLD